MSAEMKDIKIKGWSSKHSQTMFYFTTENFPFTIQNMNITKFDDNYIENQYFMHSNHNAPTHTCKYPTITQRQTFIIALLAVSRLLSTFSKVNMTIRQKSNHDSAWTWKIDDIRRR